ncbi:MAG: glycosyltransferase [bacterium]
MMEQTNNTKKIKILYLTTSSKIGGSEQVILAIMENINRDQFDIEVCTLGPRGALHEELDKLKVKNYSLDIVKKNWMHIPIGFYKLYKLLKKENYEILNTWLFHASVAGIFINKFVKIPCVVESRQYADLMYKYNLKIRQTLDRIASHEVDHIIACSDGVKKVLMNYERVEPWKITVIYNGTEINKFKPRNIEQRQQIKEKLKVGDKIVLTFTAHLRPAKGHQYLLEAISKIKNQYPNIVLFLIGDGILMNELTTITKQLDIENNVRFWGYRADIPNFLSATDIYVHPSVEEGFGIAIIEAMAAGLPVIATNVGGIPEIITNGVNGILVPPENPQALADAIVELIEHPDRRKILSEKARQYVELTFNNQTMTKEYAEIYFKLVKDHC